MIVMRHLVLSLVLFCVTAASVPQTTVADGGTNRHLTQYLLRAGQCGVRPTVVLFNGRQRPDLEEIKNLSPPMSKIDTSDVEYIPASRAACLADASAIPGTLIVYDQGNFEDLSMLSSINQVGGDLIIFGSYMRSGSLSSLNGLQNLVIVGGDLNIVQIDGIEDLTDFSSLNRVDGDLIIWGNGALRSLDGLQRLQRIGKTLYVDNNRSMKTLTGLENVAEIGYDLFLKGNGQLSDLSALEGVTRVWGNVIIEGMNGLKTTKDLKNIEVIGIGIDIHNNPRLEDLEGFESLTVVNGDLVLSRNKVLKTTAGLEGIERVHLNLVISQNPSLEDLSGLKNIKEVGGLIAIQDNDMLEHLIGLGKISTVAEDVYITRNAGLKTIDDLAVTMVGTNLGGNVVIEDNGSLDSFGPLVQKLKTINGGVRIDGNGRLPAVDIRTIEAKAVE